MPNLDCGHYFLTCLAPIRTFKVDGSPGETRRDRSALAETLALLPTGRQTAASPPGDPPSPFARNTQNHFARFVIVDQPSFNGRVSGDTLLGLLPWRKTDPLVPQPVDRLAQPFLLFAADIDARGDAAATLRAYTDTLWATMAGDLVEIFGHCTGFAATNADQFHKYITDCQVETTMPFNDYWATTPDLPETPLRTTPLFAAAGVAALALVVWLAALGLDGVLALFGAGQRLPIVAAIVAWGVVVVPLLVGVVLLLAYLLYRRLVGVGRAPFRAGPSADLPAVLKALFVQQQFTRFAIDSQGQGDAALHAAFGRFLAAVAPDERTQAAGEFRSVTP